MTDEQEVDKPDLKLAPPSPEGDESPEGEQRMVLPMWRRVVIATNGSEIRLEKNEAAGTFELAKILEVLLQNLTRIGGGQKPPVT